MLGKDIQKFRKLYIDANGKGICKFSAISRIKKKATTLSIPFYAHMDA
jgi:hypothetical protein